MTTTITINGQDFEYPVTGDTSWGGPATNWAQAASLHLLQKTGGAFTLTADVNFGATFGLTSVYYKSITTPRSGVGVLRLANTDDIAWRNNADSANLLLSVGTDDLIEFGGVDLALVTQLVTTFLGLSDTPSSYSGQALLVPRVNAGETAIEFAAITVAKTFQDVYDDDIGAAVFDLDASGSFSVRDSGGNAQLTINETGVPFTVLDAGVVKMTVENHPNALFGTDVGFNDQSVAISAASGTNLLTLEKYDLTGVATLTLLADFAASPTPRIQLQNGNARVVIDSLGGTDGDLLIGGATALRLRGGNGTDKKSNITFTADSPSDQTINWIGGTVDDTSAIKRLFTIRPATDAGTVFTREDSRYIDFFDGSTVRATIQRNGVMTGPMNESSIYTEKHDADSAAGDASAEHIFFSAQNPITITRVVFLPDAALTANDTNFATLIIARRDSAGINQATIVSIITNVAGTGNWTAFDAVDFGTLSATAVAANEVLTFEITKDASGVVVPSGTIQVEYTLD